MNKGYLNNQGFLIKKADLTPDEKKQLIKELTVCPVVFEAFAKMSKPEKFAVFRESPNYFFVPKFWGIEKFGKPKDLIKPPQSINVKPVVELRPYQMTGYLKTISSLESVGGGILSVFCGWGKTAVAIFIAMHFGYKTLVVVNKDCLMSQWIESITKFTGGKARIGIIQQSKCEIEDKDFVIAMIHTLSQKDFPEDRFNSFGICIIDECHHVSSNMFSKILLKVCLKYMLGLSATPIRKDGLSHVFHKFLGPLCHFEKRTGSNKITVKRITLDSSSPEYDTLLMASGTKNTSLMTTNLTKLSSRNQLLLECLKALLKSDERKILVLSGRREHLETLHDLINKEKILNCKGELATFGYYYGNDGSNKKKHAEMLTASSACDIILGTCHIASEGLDVPNLNSLVFASPSSDIIQSCGRILRKVHNLVPYVVDLIDKSGNFVKHGKIREKFYKSEDYDIHDIKINLDIYKPTDPIIEKFICDTPITSTSISTTTHSDDSEEEEPMGLCI